MKGEIIAAMATDMNIKKFHNETDMQYVPRVLYSAIACWMKTIALDRSVYNNSVSTGVSKKHMFEKTVRILSSFLQRFPEAKYWFYLDENHEDPIHLLRRRLMQNGDLLPVGFNTDIVIAPESISSICSGVNQIKGVVLDSGVFYSGVSTLSKDAKVESANIEVSVVEWLDDFCTTAWWENGLIKNETVEYFNSAKNVRNVHSCWQNNEVGFTQDIRLVRITINKNMYEYYLERRKNEKIQHHKIDPFLTELKEYRKIMFALRKKAGAPLPAKITIFDDHAVLNIWAYLPYETRNFLEAYAWPSRNISDVLEWIVPLCLVEETVKKLDSLGMIVTEENHG